MQHQITLRDLARKLGLHPTTVSMGLRNHPEIAEATRKRIQALTRQMHYSPNYVARSLRQRVSSTLGVLFPYVTLPYYATLLDAIYTEARIRELKVEVHFHQWSVIQEQEALRILVERRPRGLIVIPATLVSPENWRRNVGALAGIPVAIVGLLDKQQLAAPIRGCVATDIQEGGRLLGAHLRELGHRQIVLVTPEQSGQTGSKVYVDGLREGLAPARGAAVTLLNLTDDEEKLRPYGNEQQGFNPSANFSMAQLLAEKLLALPRRPGAVVTSDEPTAHVLLSHLYAQGLRVPDDVSVACFNGTFLSAYGPVPLTCIAQPFERMARRLIEMAASGHASPGRGKPETVLLPPTLIQRASVARLDPKGR